VTNGATPQPDLLPGVIPGREPTNQLDKVS
jgi:hypothetical protein